MLLLYLFVFLLFLILTYFFLYSEYHSCRMLTRTSRKKIQSTSKLSSLQVKGLKVNTFDIQQVDFPMYVISIDTDRFHKARQRFSSWYKHVELWDGVKGYNAKLINESPTKQVFQLQNKTIQLKPYTFYRFEHKFLRKGEMGCYLSHVTLWQNIIKRKIPYSIIMEDDCAMTEEHCAYINQTMTELQIIDPDWDIFYMSRLPEHSTDEFYYSENLCRPKEARGTHAYILSLSGAQHLVRNHLPIQYPVDVYISRQLKHLRCYATTKNIFHQVDLFDSFTTNIV